MPADGEEPPRTCCAVPARDAQIILGHSRLAVTLEIYTHADEQAQRDAVTRFHDLFDGAHDCP